MSLVARLCLYSLRITVALPRPQAGLVFYAPVTSPSPKHTIFGSSVHMIEGPGDDHTKYA